MKDTNISTQNNRKTLSERDVQIAVVAYLYKIGWGTNAYIKQTDEKGVDIRVQNNIAKSRYYFIETKGESNSASARSVFENIICLFTGTNSNENESC